MSSLKEYLKTWSFALILFLTSFFGTIFMLFPIAPFMVFAPRLYCYAADRLIAFWIDLVMVLIQNILRVKFRVYGDKIHHKENALHIMNHRTRLDWMFYWYCLRNCHSLAFQKIVLKSSLKHVFGGGWAMQCASFIFLRRRWEYDKDYLDTMLQFLSQVRHPSHIVMFPEGTDLCPNSLRSSDKYAVKNDLVKYKYVLYPRTTGLCFMIQRLRALRHIDAVYDILIRYPDNIVQTEIDLVLNGSITHEVEFIIKRFDVTSLPETDDGLAQWCSGLWKEKESILRNFYERNDEVTSGLNAIGSSDCSDIDCKNLNCNNMTLQRHMVQKINSSSSSLDKKKSSTNSLQSAEANRSYESCRDSNSIWQYDIHWLTTVTTVSYWCAFLFLVSYWLLIYRFLLCYLFIGCVYYVSVDFALGGLELIHAYIFSRIR